MEKITKLIAAATVALSVPACSGNEAPDSDEVTETQMDEVEVIDGTISDQMVDVDTMRADVSTGDNTAELPEGQEPADTDAAPAETPAE